MEEKVTNHEPEIKVVEVGTMPASPAPEPKQMHIDDLLIKVNGSLGAIIGKLYEFLPTDLANRFANDIGMNMSDIRIVIEAVIKDRKRIEQEKKPEEQLIPNLQLVEEPVPEKEGEPDGSAADSE